ncbi:MAG: ATP-binding protein [Spirochaetota bacterium]
MIARPAYIAQLRRAESLPLLPVLTGIRRSGKSSILDLYAADLIERGTNPARILKVNMESLKFDHLREYAAMARYVAEKLPDGGVFLLDEVQEVASWERLAASLLADGAVRCVLTGSNAALLSSDLGTLLTGRVTEIPVETLSFAELAAVAAPGSTDELLARYLRVGGFPVLHALDYDDESAATYDATLVDAILMRDVVQRHSIRDPDALRRILAFAYDNVGNVTSARRITDYWKSQRRSVSVDTTVNYLNYLCESFLLRRVRRLDVRGRQHLEYGEKYYAGDIGLRRGLLGNRSSDIAGVLENVVYLELVRRGARVSVAIVGDREIDFVARAGTSVRYYQVCAALDSQATIDREFGALEAAEDQWPKTVITLAPAPMEGRNGIPVVPLREFLLGTEQADARARE